MDKHFYLRFENLHRGRTAEIKSRFKKYEKILSLVAGRRDACKFLDLGCGRGEFLSYLASLEIKAIGIEKDIGVVPEKPDNSLEVIEEDALLWLKSAEDNSYDFISAIHVIEHLEFSYFYELTKEIKRVLKTDGVLFFETPNPDNLIVATSNFYTDPSHLRLMPQNLVDFVVRDIGFYKTFVWGVNESPIKAEHASVNNILGGASPDYAFFALANNVPSCKNIEEFLSEKKGRTTAELCDLFEQRYSKDNRELAERIYESNCFHRDQYLQITKEIFRLRDTFEKEFERIHTSWSWRITTPMRQIARLYKKCFSVFVNAKSNFLRMSLREFLQTYRNKILSLFYFLIDKGRGETALSNDESERGVFYKRYKKLLANLKMKKK